MTWWRQKEAEDRLRVTVEAILSAATVRRLQESDRHIRSKEGSEGVSRDSE